MMKFVKYDIKKIEILLMLLFGAYLDHPARNRH